MHLVKACQPSFDKDIITRKSRKGIACFIFIYIGLVVLYGPSMACAHYHSTDKILIKMKIIFWLHSPHLVGSCLHGLCDQAKQFIFYAKKELFTNRIFGWRVVRMCGAFYRPWKSLALQHQYPINVLKKVTARSHHVSKREPSSNVSGWRSSDCQDGPRSISCAVTYTGPMILKGLVSRERVDMNLGNPIDISDIKKNEWWRYWNSRQSHQAEFQRLDDETKQWHNDKAKPTLVVYPHPCPHPLPLSLLS